MEVLSKLRAVAPATLRSRCSAPVAVRRVMPPTPMLIGENATRTLTPIPLNSGTLAIQVRTLPLPTAAKATEGHLLAKIGLDRCAHPLDTHLSKLPLVGFPSLALLTPLGLLVALDL